VKARDNGLSASEIIALERGGTLKESLNVHDVDRNVEYTLSKQDVSSRQRVGVKMELKPCPFCGNTDIFFSPHSDWCFCEKDKCPGSAGIEFWQSRPIEDALRTRIAELESLLKLVTPELNNTDVLSAIQEIFQLRWKDRIAELENDKIRLANEYCELAKVWQEHECKPDVVWHKYPDEKPDLKPIPSTNLHTLLAVVSAGGDPEVEMVIVEPTEAMLHWRRADYGWYAPEQILYWAYLPEPPREVTNDEN